MLTRFPMIWFVVMVTFILIEACGGGKETRQAEVLKDIANEYDDYDKMSLREKYEVAHDILHAGGVEQAQFILRDITRQEPGILAARFTLAGLYEDQAQVEIVELDEDEDEQIRLVSGPDLAVQTLESLIEEHPEYLSPYSRLTLTYLQSGRTEDAKSLFIKASETDSSFYEGDYIIAVLNLKLGKFEVAEEALTVGINQFSELYNSYKSLGDIRRVSGEDTLALDQYRLAEKHPSDAYDIFKLYSEMAKVYLKLNNTRLAEAYAQKCLRLFPGYESAQGILDQIYGKVEEVEQP